MPFYVHVAAILCGCWRWWSTHHITRLNCSLPQRPCLHLHTCPLTGIQLRYLPCPALPPPPLQAMDLQQLDEARSHGRRVLEKDPWATEGRLVHEHKALQVRQGAEPLPEQAAVAVQLCMADTQPPLPRAPHQYTLHPAPSPHTHTCR